MLGIQEISGQSEMVWYVWEVFPWSISCATHILLCLCVGQSVWVGSRRRTRGLGNAGWLRVTLAHSQQVVQRLCDTFVAVLPGSKHKTSYWKLSTSEFVLSPHLSQAAQAICVKVCQVGGFLRVLRFPPPVKLTFHHHHRLNMTLAVAETLIPNKNLKPLPGFSKANCESIIFSIINSHSLTSLCLYVHQLEKRRPGTLTLPCMPACLGSPLAVRCYGRNVNRDPGGHAWLQLSLPGQRSQGRTEQRRTGNTQWEGGAACWSVCTGWAHREVAAQTPLGSG